MSLPSENFTRLMDTQQARFALAVQEVCTQIAAWAREEHSYTDRTGDTTASTQGYLVEVELGLIRGRVSSAMPYDVFLELARGGKWAYLMPVIERHRDDITRVFVETLGKGGASVEGSAFGFIQKPDLRSDYEAYKDASRK